MLTRCLRMAIASQKPHVWINKNTKVICQGMTGNQVSTFLDLGNLPD